MLQDGIKAATHGIGLDSQSLEGLSGMNFDRQKHGSHGAGKKSCRSRPNLKATLIAFDNFLRNPEPEACTALAFSCVEGLEDSSHRLFRDAMSGIRNADPNASNVRFGLMRAAGAHDESATGAHGIDSITDEIAQDLSDVAIPAENSADRPVLQIELDVRIAYSSSE